VKFSYNWIRELVPGLDCSPRDLMSLITMKTAECEGVEDCAPVPGCASDSVIEVDNKSLTHRPDLWGHVGMAREAAAITGRKLKDPVDISRLPNEPHGEWKAGIQDYDLCPRYSALVFENVKVGPSPLWLQARLQALGFNPISNIVDVTNYVMAELAQPMHAFDAARLHGRTIFVRRAADGERFDALNGESYTLNPSNLVIADARGAVALAGVIGGAHSAIGEQTSSIVLESANFDPASVRRTSSAHKLRTDASMRFEKGQDPVNTTRALARAIVLFEAVCPGIRLAGGLVDDWKRAAAPGPIELRLDWLARRLGRAIEADDVRRILESLEFGVEERRSGVFSVSVPSWRATRDITIEDDLLEEVGRMVGYGAVPPVAPLLPVVRPWVNRERLFHHEVRLMCAAQGFTETYNYSFISEEMARRFSLDPEEHLRVANPISAENTLMRTTLLPGMHRNIVGNARFFGEFRLFEIGAGIHKREGGLPSEEPHLMAAVYTRGDGAAGMFELKRLAECLMPGCEVRPAPARVYEHPARAGVVHWRGAETGRLYELHPSLLETGRAAILDAGLGPMQALGPMPRQYTPPRRFPSSEFDLSVVAGLRDLAGAIAGRIRAAAGGVCESVAYVYSYRGAPLSPGEQSMTFRVRVSAPDRTLSSEEVSAVRAAIIESLRGAGYGLRV
jgi:phenylalanyl-tRNA synthetase beta chain